MRGTNPTWGRANPLPWPHAHALMARVPLGLAQLSGGQWAHVSGGQSWGDPRPGGHQGGGSGEVHLDSSHYLGSISGPLVARAAGEVVAGSVMEMQEAELGTSFLPMAQHPHCPSWQLGAGPLAWEWGGCQTPCAVRPGGLVVEKTPRFVFGLRAEELQNAAFWGLSRGGGLA